MDDYAARARYVRHNIPRRKKRSVNDSTSRTGIIFKQLVISILLLVVVGMIKSINTPATNFITEKVRWVLFQNTELKSVFSSIDKLVGKIKGDKNANPDDAAFNEDALPASSSVQEADIADNDISVKLIVPVEGAVIYPFGESVHPLKKTIEIHNGIDIETGNGAAIKASLDGQVAEVGNDRTYARYVKVKSADGFTIVYAHCSQLLVAKGDEVKQGDIVAKTGSADSSTGAHLHFEIWKDGKPLNPLELINVPLN